MAFRMTRIRIISAISSERRSAGILARLTRQRKTHMSYTQLTEHERYQISILLKEGYCPAEIARSLERSASSIIREIKRNTGLRGYRPKQAQRLASERRSSAHKHRKLTADIIDDIQCLIRQELSPEQVCLYLQKAGKVSLHFETVYQLIYQDMENGGDLYTHLRTVPKPYRKRYGRYDRRGRIQDAVSIDERPVIVDRKLRIGDWEGDTVIGKGKKTAILTLVERKSLYTVIAKLDGKQAEPLAKTMIEIMKPHIDQIHTVTFDNGLEFSAHKEIADKLEVNVYFAHAYASYERGINENTNGLIRQYFPKGTDFSEVTDEQIQFVMDRLNQRPRKSRGGQSPNEIFLGLQVDLLAAV